MIKAIRKNGVTEGGFIYRIDDYEVAKDGKRKKFPMVGVVKKYKDGDFRDVPMRWNWNGKAIKGRSGKYNISVRLHDDE